MLDDLLGKTGPRYIPLMMLLTRPICLVGGGLTIYYMNLATWQGIDSAARSSFVWTCAICVLISTVATVLLSLRETIILRGVLADAAAGTSITEERSAAALREAMTFNGRHHRSEAWLVPATTVLPIALLSWGTGAPGPLIVQTIFGGFVGISTVLLLTYFAANRWMAPVIHALHRSGARVDVERLPREHLRTRMTIGFGLTIAVTAIMIGALANQRVQELAYGSPNAAALARNLRGHTIAISVTALVTGLVLSQLLARSVTDRVERLVAAMRRVAGGDLTERVSATGNDEIDVLTRQFNAMVQRLFVSDEQLRHVNANLEAIVGERTAELRERERELEASLQKLREHDQLKTEFFSNVSHELRTPLQMILSPLDRVLDGPDVASLPAEVTRDLGTMRINGHRLLRLIGQLLDFAKLDEGLAEFRPQPTDAAEVLTSLVEAARPLSDGRGLALELVVDPTLPPVRADVAKLEAVVGNLISNALKFTPRGGRVLVSATSSGGDGVRFDVKDTGIGIAPEDVPRIFERFGQVDGSTSREYAGTGLGMPLAKEYVELHGSRLEVVSEPDHGSRFSFSLPFATESAVSSRPGTESSDSGRRMVHFPDLLECQRSAEGDAVARGSETDESTATILVVDDVPEMRFHVGDLLRERYHVRFAADGAEAFEVALQHRPDVIVSDVMMPGVDGYELCSRLRADERMRATPILLLTARAGVVPLVEGLECGADDYLSKPFDPTELHARVAALVRLARLHAELDDRNLSLEAAMAELKRAQSRLVQSEKMRALGELSAGIAHELNNAINVVHNGIRPLAQRAHRLRTLVDDLVERHTGEVSRSAVDASFKTIFALADAIEQGSDRTARIVGDLRTFSHPGTETPLPHDVHASLDLCLNLLGAKLRDRIAIERDLCDDGRIVAPEGRLNQVFLNVLDNAQQAIDGEGTIRIATERSEGTLVVRISDTGPGLPPDLLGRVFDPFVTTKPPGEGTGLGLSVSYGIIRDLGGSLEVENAAEGGATFTISVPVAPPEPPVESSRTHDPFARAIEDVSSAAAR